LRRWPRRRPRRRSKTREKEKKTGQAKARLGFCDSMKSNQNQNVSKTKNGQTTNSTRKNNFTRYATNDEKNKPNKGVKKTPANS